jgi:signal recognition particle subunit SRP54
LMPGMSKELRQAADQIDDSQVSQVEAIVRSMTPKERADPSVVDGSRRVRIARGSGTSTQDVNQLLKQFREMQKMMRGMGSGNMPGMPSGRLGRLAAARGMAGGGAEESLAEMLSTRSGPAPGPSGRPSGAAKGRGGKSKKKGGRVTPPKGR